MKSFSFLLCFFTLISLSYAQVPTNGLVAYYPFNGNANDQSGNGNNGVVNGATLTTDRFGNANSAYDFNGTNNYINVPNSTSLQSSTTEMTISVWFNGSSWYPSGPGEWLALVCKSLQYTVTVYKSGNLYQIGSLVVPTISLNTWYHVVMTIANGRHKVYLNGNFVGEGTGGIGTTFSGELLMGYDPPGLVEYLNGKLDDVSIYNRALSAVEVQQLYRPGTVTFIQPQITLSSSGVALGSSMSVRGEGFSPSGSVKLQFFGAAGYFSATAIADINGKFTYAYTANSLTAQQGTAVVRVYDVVSGIYASNRFFEITSTQALTQPQILEILSPVGATHKAGATFYIVWKDKMYINYNGITYPRVANSAHRLYKYTVEWKQTTGTTWSPVQTITGDALIETTQFLKTTFSLPTAGQYQIRVKDEYANVIVTSDNMTIAQDNSNLVVNKKWDYSLNRPLDAPIGVAADGTARIYLVVSKQNTNTGAAIASIKGTINESATPQQVEN